MLLDLGLLVAALVGLLRQCAIIVGVGSVTARAWSLDREKLVIKPLLPIRRVALRPCFLWCVYFLCLCASMACVLGTGIEELLHGPAWSAGIVAKASGNYFFLASAWSRCASAIVAGFLCVKRDRDWDWFGR